jgi:hypothetical protein
MNNITKTLAILSAILAVGTAVAGFAVQNAFAQQATTAGSSAGTSGGVASAANADGNSASAGSGAGDLAGVCATFGGDDVACAGID